MIAVRKYRWVDAVRAIAILMVIATHSGQDVPGTSKLLANAFEYGQMGVQLFFIASAITLCMSAAARKNEPNPILAFYTRRIFRIAPLYYVGIVFYCVWASLPTVFETHTFHISDQYTAENVLANLLFVHGFVSGANNTIVPGGWSIGTEFAFYAAFPLLWALFERASVKRQLLLAASILGAAVFVLVAMMHFTFENIGVNTFLYFNICNQIGVFLVGIMLYRHYADGNLVAFPTATLLAFTAASLIAWKARFFLLVPVLSAASYVGLIELLRSSCEPVLRFLQPIGRYSFSMYIFHFFLLDVLKYVFDIVQPARYIGSDISLVLFFFSASLTTFFLASITFRLIERPFITFSNRITTVA